MKPSVPVTSPSFQYRPACSTDVQAVWRRAGWRPKAEAPAAPPKLAVLKRESKA